MNTVTIAMTVNGEAAGPHVVPADLSMNDYLREYLGLTGTKFGCGIGECHACVIILDLPGGTSESIRTCITPADYFAGQKVRTVEGHAKDGQPTPVQAAFLDHFAFQCGYCTPGFINEAQVLVENLARVPVDKAQVEARILDAMNPHICRCTGYVRYYAALKELILGDARLTR